MTTARLDGDGLAGGYRVPAVAGRDHAPSRGALSGQVLSRRQVIHRKIRSLNLTKFLFCSILLECPSLRDPETHP